jgi:hypothetical protein
VPCLLDADFWRGRVEEARAVAEAMTFPDAMREMLSVAGAYERLADNAARTAGRSASRERS